MGMRHRVAQRQAQRRRQRREKEAAQEAPTNGRSHAIGEAVQPPASAEASAEPAEPEPAPTAAPSAEEEEGLTREWDDLVARAEAAEAKIEQLERENSATRRKLGQMEQLYEAEHVLNMRWSLPVGYEIVEDKVEASDMEGSGDPMPRSYRFYAKDPQTGWKSEQFLEWRQAAQAAWTQHVEREVKRGLDGRVDRRKEKREERKAEETEA